MKQFIKLPIMVAETKDIIEFEEAIQEEIKYRELINKEDDEELDIELPLSERLVWVNIGLVEMIDRADNEAQSLLLINDGDIIVNLPLDELVKLMEEHGC